MTCTACGQLHGATNRVHFAKATDARPCPGSWDSGASPKAVAKLLAQPEVRELFVKALDSTPKK